MARRLIGLAVLVGALALAVLLTQRRVETPVAAVRSDEPSIEAVSPSVAREETRSAPASCTASRLEIVERGKRRVVCVGALSAVQNGSVRSYLTHELRIDAVGTRVIAARFGDAQCREPACKGISISGHDAQGLRTITLAGATLAHADGTTTIDGKLRAPTEEQVGACEGQGVSVVTADGSASSFCPKGGAGFEIGSDGARTYRFTNLDGDSILITVDDAHAVMRVTYETDQTFACARGPCSVRVSPADASGARTFVFGGTSVIDTTSGQRSAVLNGTLLLPPL